MDYEELENISNTSYEEVTQEMSTHRLVIQGITFAIFCLIGILANIVIIYTILKFQKLRDVSNMTLLLNWAVADVFSLAVIPSAYIISSRKLKCVILNLSVTLHSCIFVFAVAICINWALESYYKKGHSFVKRNLKLIIKIVWCVTIILCIVHIMDCLDYNVNYGCHTCVIIGCLMATFLAVMISQISRAVCKCCKRHTEVSPLMLNLATIYFSCWILGFTPSYMFIHHHTLLFISECLIFSSSFTNLSLLYFYNDEFKACLLQVLKRTNDQPQQSISDFENPLVNVNGRPDYSFKTKTRNSENV